MSAHPARPDGPFDVLHHPAGGQDVLAPQRRSPDDALVARDLVKQYTKADTLPALGGVDLVVSPGESLAVMGPSGSGKTTLLHVLAGILTPTSGSVHWHGHDLARLSDGARSRLRRTDFGFVFQSGHLLPELPAIENVALPLMLAGRPRRQATDAARALFRPLGLEGLEHRRPGELSGGQAQRVAVARAVVGRPGVVFADEPTGALDQQTAQDVLGHLHAMCAATGAALVVVTHDRDVAAGCERVVHMRDGLVVGQEHRPGAAPRDAVAPGDAALTTYARTARL